MALAISVLFRENPWDDGSLKGSIVRTKAHCFGFDEKWSWLLCSSYVEYHGWESLGEKERLVIKSSHLVLVVGSLLGKRVSWSVVRN